jgi:hypothetical protein
MTARSTTVLLIGVALLGCGPGTGTGGSGGGKGGSGGSGGSGGGSGGGGGGNVVCSRINCAGCCNGSQCELGDDVSACGKDAAMCAVCGNNQVCDAVTKVCGADPLRNWRVYPSAAQIAPSDLGTAWDSDGSAPDVVITMTCPSTTGAPIVGGAETQGYSPGWPATSGCVLKASDLLGPGFSWSAADIDLIGSDPICAATTVIFSQADLVAGLKTIAAANGVTSITFRLAAP